MREKNVFKIYTDHIDINEFRDKDILDYGCGSLRLPKDAVGVIDMSRYTGLEIRPHLVDYCKESLPQSKIIYQDLYNIVYNPKGELASLQPIEEKFDLILSYSVFSHTTLEQFQESIEILRESLNPGGYMLLSFLSINNRTVLHHLRKKRIKNLGRCDRIPESIDTVAYMVEDKWVDELPHEANYMISLINPEVLEPYGEIFYNEYQNLLKVTK